MKKKELKNLAKKIAGYESIIQTNSDPKLIAQAKGEIMKLTGKITDFQDLEILDDLILEILDN